MNEFKTIMCTDYREDYTREEPMAKQPLVKYTQVGHKRPCCSLFWTKSQEQLKIKLHRVVLKMVKLKPKVDLFDKFSLVPWID